MSGRTANVATGLVLALVGALLLVELAEPPRVPVSDPLGPHGLPRVLAGGLVVVGALLVLGAVRRRPAPPAGTAGEPAPALPPPVGSAPDGRAPAESAPDGREPAGSGPAGSTTTEPAMAELTTEPATAEPTTEPTTAEPAVAAPAPAGPPTWLVTTLTIVATVGYVVALPKLGFVLATGLLGIGLLPLLGARRWHTVIGVPIVLTAVLWFVFSYLLDVGLPGFLGRY